MQKLPSHEHHTMRYVGLRSNYHEFLCDVCGRHLLMHSTPSKMEASQETFVVLNQGDVLATHSGGVGGLTFHRVENTQDSESMPLGDSRRVASSGSGKDEDAGEVQLSEEWKGWLTDILRDFE